MWRFLTRELWWQAHPYSLSALPQPPYLRFTVKGLGDSSRALAQLRPGTRVAFEGPYGAFTDHARLSDGVLLVAAGVGITPLRALLEDLPAHADVVVIVRASTVADIVHRRRSPPLSSTGADGSTRSSDHAIRSGSPPARFGISCPTSSNGTSTSAARRGSAPR